ncbi:hypothetical protein H310_07235 [Aphanomyces invadans]|uniref:Cyclin-like domain-containing protein n=1 Tax=Aphanomyces invadans TaxID=157072 RepID=A0A024U2K3_9STRA|nr:hypothetical protein H310_07235 [Aphanomyces invadans]ETW00671.1 hypothetical protein H310_07235 [Aphanomyces invadans]|eukprot:XP_008870806.1 hypothetical protein H310_07235 [Aphanomyces invadans]
MTAPPSTPSQLEGLSGADEKQHRFFACELIQESGILLQLPQVVLATAQSLLHRFYARQSLFDFDAFRAAMGCIFLASKAEEHPRRIKDVVQVFFRMRNRRMDLGLTPMLPSDPRFATWSDWLVMVERQVLIEVGFSIDGTTEHPHKFLLYYVKLLECSDACAQKAWNYVNDSFRIDLCLRYDAHVIACAAISLAARVLQHALPLGWEVLLEVDMADVLSVAQEMLALYQLRRVQWLQPLTAVDPFEVTKDDELATIAVDAAPAAEHPQAENPAISSSMSPVAPALEALETQPSRSPDAQATSQSSKLKQGPQTAKSKQEPTAGPPPKRVQKPS